MAITNFLDEFFLNSKKIKELVKISPDISEKVADILDKKAWQREGTTAKYAAVTDDICLKERKNIQGAQECAITADIYNPIFPTPDFIVLIDDFKQGWDGATYLTRNFGQIRDVRKEEMGEADARLFEDFWMHMIEHGYQINLQSLEGCVGLNKDGLVIFDLDSSTFDDIVWRPIIQGVMDSKGHYKNLGNIYQKIRSPEYRLDI